MCPLSLTVSITTHPVTLPWSVVPLLGCSMGPEWCGTDIHNDLEEDLIERTIMIPQPLLAFLVHSLRIMLTSSRVGGCLWAKVPLQHLGLYVIFHSSDWSCVTREAVQPTTEPSEELKIDVFFYLVPLLETPNEAGPIAAAPSLRKTGKICLPLLAAI